MGKQGRYRWRICPRCGREWREIASLPLVTARFADGVLGKRLLPLGPGCSCRPECSCTLVEQGCGYVRRHLLPCAVHGLPLLYRYTCSDNYSPLRYSW